MQDKTVIRHFAYLCLLCLAVYLLAPSSRAQFVGVIVLLAMWLYERSRGGWQ